MIRGGAERWPAVQKWTWSWLGRECGASILPVRFANGQGMPLSLALLLSLFRRADGGKGHGYPYGVNWQFERDHPELLRDVGCPRWARGDWLQRLPDDVRPLFRWLYVGGAGSGSPLHQDVLGTHGWVAQLRGKKRWVLYRPDELTGASARTHDAFTPRGRADDRREGRVRWETVLSTGDLLFVPSLWWHQVRNLSPSIALTANFAEASNFERVCGEAARGGFVDLARALGSLSKAALDPPKRTSKATRRLSASRAET